MNFLKWRVFLRFRNGLRGSYLYVFLHLYIYVTKIVKEEAVNLRGMRGKVSMGKLEQREGRKKLYNYNLIKNNPQSLIGKYGSFNKDGSIRLICLKTLSLVGGTV